MANEHIEGRGGVAPPPGADLSPSQPLRADAGTIIDTDGVAHRPIDKALANERALAPLTYRDSIATAAAELAGTAVPGVVQAPAPVTAAVVAAPPVVLAPTAGPRVPDPTQPAASNSDSPSRGMPGTAYSPHRAKDPLAVEGGFGIGSGEYFALDGQEMKVCLQQLLDEVLSQAENDARVVGLSGATGATLALRAILLADTEDQTVTLENAGANPDGDLVAAITTLCDAFHRDLQTDLRMGLAWTYPSYGVILTLTVCAYAGHEGFTIQKHRREFDETGEPETPPDALREELGLPIPGRQVVIQGNLGPMSSDVRI